MTKLEDAKYTVRAGKKHMATPIGLYATLEEAKAALAKLKYGDIVTMSGVVVEVKS